MPDQAEKLRQMIAEESPLRPPSSPAPPMIVVSGSKGGVGATTVAMNLAAALADGGPRVVLVDAANHHANLPELAGISVRAARTLSEVLAGRSSAAEALIPGPPGTLLLADRWNAKQPGDPSSAAQQRLLGALMSLGETADLLVVDAGNGVSRWIEEFWRHAALIIITATCDEPAVMDAYATLKLGMSAAARAETRFLLNQCRRDEEAAEFERRLVTACQRFLGRQVPALPALPLHARDIADMESVPRVWEVPTSEFGHAVLWLASAVSRVLEGRSHSVHSTSGVEPDSAFTEGASVSVNFEESLKQMDSGNR